MQVYWLEHRAEDVPPMDDWLSAGETVSLNGFRFAKRRADWRLGRWTAKHAVASFLNLPAHPRARQTSKYVRLHRERPKLLSQTPQPRSPFHSATAMGRPCARSHRHEPVWKWIWVVIWKSSSRAARLLSPTISRPKNKR